MQWRRFVMQLRWKTWKDCAFNFPRQSLLLLIDWHVLIILLCFFSLNWQPTLEGLMAFFKMASDLDNKAITLGALMMMTLINNKHRCGFSSLIKVEANVKNVFHKVYFKPQSPIYTTINEKIMRLSDADLNSYWL